MTYATLVMCLLIEIYKATKRAVLFIYNNYVTTRTIYITLISVVFYLLILTRDLMKLFETRLIRQTWSRDPILNIIEYI